MNILVLYYTQTGQLRQILDNILESVAEKASIDFVSYQPVNDFPFPWTSDQFFDAMPECVLELPSELKPFSIPDKKYDLVVLGYQPWFLSPSVPTTSFLFSAEAKKLKGVPVLTVVGSRNMWLNAQEKIKAQLHRIGANHVGNIVLADTNHNLVSLFTVIRWTFTGQKEKSKYLPEAGVQTPDILGSKKFGPVIYAAAASQNWSDLQANLLEKGAVSLKPTLIVLEKRGITNFRKFAVYIRQKGERGNPDRLPRVHLFKRLLLTGIFVLSPISGFTAKMASLFKRKTFKKQLGYFKSVDYRPDVI